MSSISLARDTASASATFLERSPNATLSSTDMCGNRAYCWNTVLTLRWCGATLDTSAPSSITRPLVGCSNPAIIFNKVVLPQPEGPSSEKNSPRPMAKSAASTATKSPNSLRTFSSTMTLSLVEDMELDHLVVGDDIWTPVIGVPEDCHPRALPGKVKRHPALCFTSPKRG